MFKDPSSFYLLLAMIVPMLLFGIYIYRLIGLMLSNDAKRRDVELQMKSAEFITPAQLAARERIVLFSERISILSLVKRVDRDQLSVDIFSKRLVATVHSEYDHNISQQLYVSKRAWAMVVDLRDTVCRAIVDQKSKSDEIDNYLLALLELEPIVSIKIEQLIQQLRNEIGLQ